MLNILPVDLAAPRAGRVPATLHKFLKAFQVAFNLPADNAHLVADIFDDAFRIIVHPQSHAAVIAPTLECDEAYIFCTGRTVSRNALVRDLLGDVGLPFLFLAANASAPEQVLVVHCLTSRTPSMNLGND